MNVDTNPSDVHEFTRPLGFLDSPTGGHALAILLFAVGLLGFFAALALDASAFAQSAATAPFALALGAVYTGYRAGKAPVKIVAGVDGLVLFYSRGERAIPWSELRWADIEESGLNQKKYLVLYNALGKSDLVVDPAFSQFDFLADLVRERIAVARPDGVPPVRLQPNWARASFLIGIGIMFTALSIVVLHMGRQGLIDAKRLDDEGVSGKGIVVRHFLAPDGRTPRIEYEVTGRSGEKATRNVEINQMLWESLDVGSEVALRHVPDAPHISELLGGEAPGQGIPKRPGAVYGLPILMLIFCAFFIACGIMTAMGIDIHWDEKTRKLNVKRLGKR